MKTKTINKVKVRIFEEDELVEKLGLSKEECDLIIQYQIKFPELLQDNVGEFVIDGDKLWNQLNKPQGEYGKWFKRKIQPLFLENVDYISVDKLVGIKNKKVTTQMLTLETAKQISLGTGVDNNSKKEVKAIGRLIRDYFILMEKNTRDFSHEMNFKLQ